MESQGIMIIPNGTEVLLPFGEEGIVKKFIDKPWRSEYVVKITKGSAFHKEGEYTEYRPMDVRLKEKNNE